MIDQARSMEGYPWGMLPPLLWVGEFESDVDLGIEADTLAIRVTPEIAALIRDGKIRLKGPEDE